VQTERLIFEHPANRNARFEILNRRVVYCHDLIEETSCSSIREYAC
jgi:hypothetical protein